MFAADVQITNTTILFRLTYTPHKTSQNIRSEKINHNTYLKESLMRQIKRNLPGKRRKQNKMGRSPMKLRLPGRNGEYNFPLFYQY